MEQEDSCCAFPTNPRPAVACGTTHAGGSFTMVPVDSTPPAASSGLTATRSAELDWNCSAGSAESGEAGRLGGPKRGHACIRQGLGCGGLVKMMTRGTTGMAGKSTRMAA